MTAHQMVDSTMRKGERKLLEWLRGRDHTDRERVPIGIGDDMAGVAVSRDMILLTADMLLDGVHFDTESQALDRIGHKAIACSLSDCAAMAVVPTAAITSVALPAYWTEGKAEELLRAMAATADRYNCPIVGGDITSWPHGLAIDVTIVAQPDEGRQPVLRSGARPGDAVYVTGKLGHSLGGRHLDFEPRVDEARVIAAELGDSLHAMMDISDGLSLDLWRICEASGCGAVLDEKSLLTVASVAAKVSPRPTLDHVLHDGEDFELLMVVDADAVVSMPACGVTRVGRMVKKSGLMLAPPDGEPEPIVPRGFEHFQ